MAWQIAITLAAIGALVLYHAFAAIAKPAGETGAAQKRDPWARILVAAAVLAALLALGVVIVPAVEGNDEAASTTPSTTTPPPTTTTTPPTTSTSPTTEPTTTTAPTTGSTTSTGPTTTAPTTTSVPSTSTRSTTTPTTSTSTTTSVPATNGGPTTTPPTSPPSGSLVVARALVLPDGSTAKTVNHLDEPFVVRRTAAGEYHVTFPGLSAEARRRSTISVKADSATSPVGGWAANGSLVVLLYDKKTGAPASRAFIFAVSAPRATLPGTT